MAKEKIEPWYTEAYARDRDKRIEERRAAGEDSWHLAERLKQEGIAHAIKFNRDTLNAIKQKGAEGYVMELANDLKDEIWRLKHPTQDDLYKYTDAFFRDSIEIYEESLEFFLDLLKDKAKLKKAVDNLATRLNAQLGAWTINTKYPENYLTPTDKVSNLAFSNKLTGSLEELAMERRGSKKQITTIASIDLDKLDDAVQIRAKKELTAYDREVHDAIVTLFVDGGNEFITPQMIYQVMTGNPNAYLNPRQAKAISDSITKFMYSRVIIDASQEAKSYGFGSFKYDGNLISGERVTAVLNGNVLECLHILRPPILYEYANKKNQIGRLDIKLLNTPINKTEEIIMLQGYLYRRILAMKGGRISKNILYDTVFNQLKVTAANDGALRKKKSKVRGQIKRILDYWEQERFISGYAENKRGQIIYHSITIRL